MSAITKTLYVEQGATFLHVETLDPLTDLTGYTGKCQVKTSAQSVNVYASPTVNIDADPTLGLFSLEMGAAETLALPCTGTSFANPTTFYYDVFFEKSGNTFKAMQGEMRVTPAITR